jgi:hypothetical protein
VSLVSEVTNDIEISRLWKRRDQLEMEIAQDFSYYLWNLGNLENDLVPQEILLNLGIGIGRLMELDSALHFLNPESYRQRDLVEIRASLYSRLP